MRAESVKFDFNKTLEAFRQAKPLTSKDGLLKPLIKQLTEAALEAGLAAHLAEEQEPNRRNGRTSKVLKKNQRSISQEMGDKILCMYSQGNGRCICFSFSHWHHHRQACWCSVPMSTKTSWCLLSFCLVVCYPLQSQRRSLVQKQSCLHHLRSQPRRQKRGTGALLSFH